MRFEAIWEAFKQDRFMMVVAGVGGALFFLSFAAPLLFPGVDPRTPDFATRLEAPSWLGGEGGIFGHDQLGRSLWIRTLYGLRTSYLIALLSVLLGASIGVVAGLTAGYLGGWVDTVVMRLTDIQMSFPALLLAMTIIAAVDGGAFVLILVLGLNSWMLYARVGRSIVLSHRSTDFVLSTVALGARPRRVVWRHLFPNSLSSLVAIATLEMARLMLGEATLSFLGFGVQPPQISLGAILAEGRDYLAHQWWVATFAGIILALAVLTTNLLGSWLERTSDPLSSREETTTQ